MSTIVYVCVCMCVCVDKRCVHLCVCISAVYSLVRARRRICLNSCAVIDELELRKEHVRRCPPQILR